jgi:ribulose-5-phosphate 4-epimerase/fuculose-1-phosphate aldolase
VNRAMHRSLFSKVPLLRRLCSGSSASRDSQNALIRRQLALAYRIVAHLQMDDHTYTHLSMRAAEANQYFIYPFGLRFDEVNPSNLIKVTSDGAIVEGSEYQYNKTGYIIHGNIYKFRPDVNAIFHLHTPGTVAVSACSQGLLPISQWALHFYKQVAYHDYNSLALDSKVHGGDLVRDLGSLNTMLMRCHGMLTCGKTVMEALFRAYHLEMACKTQCLALGTGQDLVTIPEHICEQAVRDLLSFETNLGERDWQAWVRKIEKLDPSFPSSVM